MRGLFVIVLVLGGILLSARPSLACTCHYGPAEGAAIAAAADVVFTGMARAYGEERLHSTVVEFQVNTVYKGQVAPRMHVQALGARGRSELGPGCGWGFQLGRQYTVFAADEDADGVPNTNGCFFNVEGTISAAAYGLSPGRAATSTNETIQLAIVAALALSALVLIGVLPRLRTTV